MKKYEKLTLRELKVENKRISRQIAFETILAQKQNREVNYEPIINKLNIIKEVLDKRTGKAFRDVTTKN